MTKIPTVYISGMTFDESYYIRGDCRWNAKSLYSHAEKTKAKQFNYPLVAFDQSTDNFFATNNIRDFIFQVKRVMQCDYNIPIILDDYGQIADGYHRVCKAILEGKQTIKAIRLNSMPEPDRIIKE